MWYTLDGDNMNNKGATLIEVIVVMVIIGIITVMAFPSITKLQTQNSNKTYLEYEKVLETGAKLYVDKYNRDLWGLNEGGCKGIPVQNLLNEKLIKDFVGKKNEVVDKGQTFVNVTKNNSTKKVSYQVYLVIKKGSKTVYKPSSSVSRCPA